MVIDLFILLVQVLALIMLYQVLLKQSRSIDLFRFQTVIHITLDYLKKTSMIFLDFLALPVVLFNTN